MTAPTPVPSGPAGGRAGLRGRLIEAAAKALWAGGGTALRVERRPIDFVHLAGGTQDAYRADAADTLDAVLPLLVRAVEAEHLSPEWNGKSPDDTRLAYGMGYDHAILAAAALLRSLTEEQR